MVYKISPQKLTELQDELQQLKLSKKEILERVSDARALGDLSENSEYKSARSEQRECISRIEELEHILESYKLTSPPSSTEEVAIGCEVKLKGPDSKSYRIVGSLEASPSEGRISDESPLGQSLLGKKVGDKVQIGSKSYSIELISL